MFVVVVVVGCTSISKSSSNSQRIEGSDAPVKQMIGTRGTFSSFSFSRMILAATTTKENMSHQYFLSLPPLLATGTVTVTDCHCTFIAVHDRHLDIHKNQRNSVDLCQVLLDRLLTVTCYDVLNFHAYQEVCEHTLIYRVVVYKHNSLSRQFVENWVVPLFSFIATAAAIIAAVVAAAVVIVVVTATKTVEIACCVVIPVTARRKKGCCWRSWGSCIPVLL